MYSMNENFFDVIDNENKAYFLGLMFADGNVQSNGNFYRTRLGLHKKDELIIEKFKKVIGFNGPLYRTWDRTTIQLANKKIGESLISHGCVLNKTLVLKYPQTIPAHLTNHFIRGYFDGDGCLSLNKRWKQAGAGFSICGTQDMLQGISNELKSLDIHCGIIQTGNIYMLSVNGNRQIQVLLKWLYYKSKICFVRKKNIKLKFEKLLKTLRPIRKAVPFNKMDVKDAYQSGMRIVDIEKKFNITNATMYKLLHKSGISLRRRKEGVSSPRLKLNTKR